jgi:DEAD/DEAH box helicase domain-containing protein
MRSSSVAEMAASPDVALDQLCSALKRKYGARITGERIESARAGHFVPMPPDIDARLVAALRGRGIERLYSHQAEALANARRGLDQVLMTPTASGKSLCYNLPVVEAVLRDRAKALYLFPTKALAQDQVAELMDLNEAVKLGIGVFTFDGDTPSDARRAVRTRGDIVVSNPDMLHQAILPHHSKWAQFFESLKFVVIDEVHVYRGVFGSHVANVWRRLERIFRFYGVRPQLIAASATIGNPQAHVEALTGRSIRAITESGAPAGEKRWWLWNPPVINADLGIRASARSQSTRIARSAIKRGLKSIVFASSRLLVEVITKYLKDVFDHDPRKPERIGGYRGGYLPLERRRVEKALRAGTLDGVVTTSALELGVDIGSLDVAILNGYPGSIAALKQRLGRAGRRQQPSLGVMVAGSDALDQFLVRSPALLFDAPIEHARIAPDQLLILFDHLRCAAFELPFADGEAFGGGDTVEMLKLLAERQVVHFDQGQWHWIEDSYPAQSVSLRSIADGNFVVVDATDGGRKIIAEVDFSGAALTLYEGAIYLIQAEPWQVERLDWTGRKAYVKRTAVDYYTDAIDYTKLKELARFEVGASGQGHCGHGEVHVVRRVTGYKKIRYYTHENLGYGPISLPDQELHSTAPWWRLPQQLLEASFTSRFDALEGFLGAAQALHTIAVLRAMAEPRDLSKAVGSAEGDWFVPVAREQTRSDERLSGSVRAAFSPTLFLYDNYPGGVGLTEPLFNDRIALIADALTLVSGCTCAHGCPACVGPVLTGERPGAASIKASAVKVLQLLDGRPLAAAPRLH